MSKRIYVAAPWIARAEARDLATTLEAYGYTITQPWWQFEGDETGCTPEFLRKCGEADIRGVRTADALVLINSFKSEGKAVEQGLALAYGIPIIAIGARGAYSNNVFHYTLPYIWVRDSREAIQKLKELFGEEA